MKSGTSNFFIQSSWAGNGNADVGVGGVYGNDNADADADDDDDLNIGKLTKNRCVLWFTASKNRNTE